MKYRYASQVGESEHGEEGKSGHRKDALEGSAIGTLQPIISGLKLALTQIQYWTEIIAALGPRRAVTPSTAPKGKSGGGWLTARPAAAPDLKSTTLPRVKPEKKRRGGVVETDHTRRLERQKATNEFTQAKLAVAEQQGLATYYRRFLELEGLQMDADGNVIGGLDLTVEYDRGAEQKRTKVRFQGGLLYTDDACTQKLDTTDMVTHFSGPGFAIYVMSESGDIHVDKHSVGNRHHSSLLAGADTAAAGELKVSAGRLEWASNKSGHYHPRRRHLIQMLHQLDKHKVPRSYQLSVFEPDATGQIVRVNYDNAQDFLDKIEAMGGGYEFMKLLAYLQHLQSTAVLDYFRWRWNHSSEAIGIYSTDTNVRVPHKMVRQTLKRYGMVATTEVQSGAGR